MTNYYVTEGIDQKKLADEAVKISKDGTLVVIHYHGYSESCGGVLHSSNLGRVVTFTVPQRDELIWLAVDLDDTLAHAVWPDPGIGEPIRLNVVKLKEAVRAGYKVVIHTSRPWADYELVESWLNHHEIPFHRIVCGKLLAVRYIDDRALPADSASWVPRDALSRQDSVTESDENQLSLPRTYPS